MIGNKVVNLEKKPNIGIIGFGTVGKSIQFAFTDIAQFKIYDIDEVVSRNTFEETINGSEYIFICVPTPMTTKGEFDSSILDSTIDSIYKLAKYTDKIIIIKSTVIPGTTEGLIKKYNGMNILFSPEFLTEKNYRLDSINPSRIIFGGMYNTEIFRKVGVLYKSRFKGQEIHFTTPTTAEMVKYTSNCFLASKVSFFNEIYDICKSLNINYDRVMKFTIMDGRIGNSHYNVPGNDGNRGFGGLCFPKDLCALISKAEELGVDPVVMKAVWEKNLDARTNKEWEKRKGVISEKD